MPLRVLVVEDDDDIRQLMRDILGKHDIEVTVVGRPELVSEVARHEKPNVFLIDVMLSERSGIEVAEELRQTGFEGTPMIAMSASTVMRHLAIQSGVFDGMLSKPFDIDSLLASVRTATVDSTQRRSQLQTQVVSAPR